jgi:ABC-2 type transport system permease protein
MRTFTAILRFELRAALRERTLPLLFALFACALAYAMGNGLRWAAARTEAFDHVRRDLAQQHGQALTRFRDAETRASSRAVSPAALAAGIWYRPTLPLAPLSFVAVGQADRFPFETRFHPTNVRAVFAPRPVSIDHPAESAAGRFDVAFVLVTVLPVLLLVACFDAWVRDRESGVARLLLAQPVSVAQLVFAKILARGGTLLAASMALLAAALVGGAQAAGLPLDVGGLLVAEAGVLGYGAFWLGVAALINLTVASAAASAVAVGATWIAVVGLAPAALGAALDLVRPPPDMGALVNALRVSELEQDEAEARAAAETRAAGPRGNALEAALAKTERQKRARAELRAPFEAQAAARLHLANTFRLFVPSVALQDTLERVAGHDADRALSFQQQVWSFIDSLHHFIRQPAPVASAESSLDERYAAVPRFAFVAPAGPDRLEPLKANLALLLGASGIALLAAGWLARPKLTKKHHG